MRNTDFKKRLNSEYEKITPDVYKKIKMHPINRLLDTNSPEQQSKRRFALTLVCIAFVILAVLVVSLFSYMLVPGAKDPTCEYVYIQAYHQKAGEAGSTPYGVIIQDNDAKYVVSLMNEQEKHSINVENVTINNLAEKLGIANGDSVRFSVIAINSKQADDMSSRFAYAFSTYAANKGITITVAQSSMPVTTSHMATYINEMNLGISVSANDSVETLMNSYVYIASKS